MDVRLLETKKKKKKGLLECLLSIASPARAMRFMWAKTEVNFKSRRVHASVFSLYRHGFSFLSLLFFSCVRLRPFPFCILTTLRFFLHSIPTGHRNPVQSLSRCPFDCLNHFDVFIYFCFSHKGFYFLWRIFLSSGSVSVIPHAGSVGVFESRDSC